MKQEITPHESHRAEAFALWMSSPMPMVTLTKSFDVSRIVRLSRRHGIKFNALLCWCIARAASEQEVFFTIPEGGKLYRYDELAINVIVKNSNAGINSCDIPYRANFNEFINNYNTLTAKCAKECKSSFLDGYMVVGTSAIIETEVDTIVNQYTDKFCNPMVMWGHYRKGWFRTTLPISFQFHHVQMDGGHAAHYLAMLQREIATLQIERP